MAKKMPRSHRRGGTIITVTLQVGSNRLQSNPYILGKSKNCSKKFPSSGIYHNRLLSFVGQSHTITPMTEQQRYEKRGVSATKDDVHNAIRNLDKGLFPTAFCKILPDVAAGNPQYCNILHADTAGTKPILAYLYWKETGNTEVWKGISQDAIVMNLDDMACVGCVDDIILSNTIGRNKHLVPGEVLSALIDGTAEFIDNMDKHGINIKLAGGETADVGDVVRTVDVGFTAFARMKRDRLLVNTIKPGDVIVGMASYGQTTYETAYNSGIGSNGLTSARHDVLEKYYANTFPESYDSNTPEDVVYSGGRRLTDTLRVDGEEIPLGNLLLSPTRTYLPVLKSIFRELHKHIHGVIHCTGGGQTKVVKFLRDARVVKDNLVTDVPIFNLIQQQSGADWKEMYQVFNMGTRMELYVPETIAPEIINVCKAFNIDARVTGHVEKGSPEVELRTPHGTFTYQN